MFVLMFMGISIWLVMKYSSNETPGDIASAKRIQEESKKATEEFNKEFSVMLENLRK